MRLKAPFRSISSVVNKIHSRGDRLWSHESDWGAFGLDVRIVPGGHLTTSEHPELLAQIIEEVAPQRGSSGARS